jgi:hypothetical protein
MTNEDAFQKLLQAPRSLDDWTLLTPPSFRVSKGQGGSMRLFSPTTKQLQQDTEYRVKQCLFKVLVLYVHLF